MIFKIFTIKLFVYTKINQYEIDLSENKFQFYQFI